jgi:hypothetical protein
MLILITIHYMEIDRKMQPKPKKVVDKDAALDYDVKTIKDDVSKAIEEKYEKILEDEMKVKEMLETWSPVLGFGDVEWLESDEEIP